LTWQSKISAGNSTLPEAVPLGFVICTEAIIFYLP
jgi:hypothetical protein